MAVADIFDYLVQTHWREGPAAAWRERDMKGTKALGATSGTLRWVPYLPFSRTVVVGESLVVGAKYLLWLFGTGKKERAERTGGWLPIRDLDLKGAAAVVRMLTSSISGNC